MIKKLLCKLGFHSWVYIGGNSMSLDHLSQCKRCKTGAMFYSMGMMEEYIPSCVMKKHWDSGKINSPSAYEAIYGYGLKM